MRRRQLGAMLPDMAMLSDDQKREIVRLFEKGVFRLTAIRAVGADVSDYANTCLVDHAFRDEAERVYAAAQARLEMTRHAAALEDAKIAGDVLATRDPMQHSPKVQAALASEAARAQHDKRGALTADVLDELRAAIEETRKAIGSRVAHVSDAQVVQDT